MSDRIAEIRKLESQVAPGPVKTAMLDLLAELDTARAALAELQTSASKLSHHPQQCPITGLPLFMTVVHPERGLVATYGGPFDSYTIPENEEDQELRCEHYDHDAGEWEEGGSPTGLLLVPESHMEEVDRQDAAARAEVERLKAEHCRDCCCAQSWKALGITDYTGRSIPEEIERLKAALSASEAQAVQRERGAAFTVLDMADGGIHPVTRYNVVNMIDRRYPLPAGEETP